MRTDSRNSYRIQVPEGTDRGVFRYGRRNFQVELLDASAGGFAFVSAKPVNIGIGTVARLLTSAGWHEVEVIRREPTPEGFVIGVARLRDLQDPRVLSEVRTKWTDYVFLPWSRVQRGGVVSSCASFATIVGIAICIFLSVYLLSGQPYFDRFLQSFKPEQRPATRSATDDPRLTTGHKRERATWIAAAWQGLAAQAAPVFQHPLVEQFHRSGQRQADSGESADLPGQS